MQQFGKQVKAKVTPEDVMRAGELLQDVVRHTPLQRNAILSDRYGCDVYLKREDMQEVRSFKIRGAYTLLQSLTEAQRKQGVVCASAGNHAQGVAFSCRRLQVQSQVFMPITTPRQKISQVALFGGDYVEIELIGDTFDDAFAAAKEYCEQTGRTFVHPFDHPLVIAGQGTVGAEVLSDMEKPVDYLFLAIGGGGLAAGVGTYVKAKSPGTKIIGVEPAGAPSMKTSLASDRVEMLGEIDKFVDGAAVRQVGELTFQICKEVLEDVLVVPEGKVCTTILSLYNENAIVAEPAGALTIAALEQYREAIQGKTVVCVVSGGNNDIDRMQEIKERSLIHEGLKHYFIIHFPQRAGALRHFIDNVLGPDDDVTRFEYTKRNNRERGPALVGIELKRKEDYQALVERMQRFGTQFVEINNDPSLFHLLI